MKKRGSKLQRNLYRLMAICIVPMAIIIITMAVIVRSFTHSYDTILDDIIKVNAYNKDFKENMDYTMYTIVVSSGRTEELIDLEEPFKMIENAKRDVEALQNKSNDETAKSMLDRILRSLDTLQDRAREIVDDSKELGYYDLNMERLDNNIRIITGLIQEQVQQYINYQVTNLDELRIGIKQNLIVTAVVFIVVFVGIIIYATFTSWRTVKGIVEPVKELCEVATTVGSGDFEVRAQSETTDELAILSDSFNDMVSQIGNLVEDVRTEQEKLRSIELQLLQEQINPHFLYNTLDTITWLSETGENEQVIRMVNALSDFFRTGLSNGKSIVSIKDEIKHVESYLQIQQFRYQDILEYDIDVDPEIADRLIPKLTLQPLVENALYHGIKNKRGMGKIMVTGKREGDSVILRVSDDGIGIKREEVERIRKHIRDAEPAEKEGGFGLRNVWQRLSLTYDEGYSMDISSVGASGTEVLITIPYDFEVKS